MYELQDDARSFEVSDRDGMVYCRNCYAKVSNRDMTPALLVMRAKAVGGRNMDRAGYSGSDDRVLS